MAVMSSKPEAFDLGQLLSGQRAQGTHDSGGEFTLSHEKAAAKLARFSLPFDYAWVLKVVQAAVAWKSSDLTVRQFRTFSSFEFRPADLQSLPDEQGLVSALLSGKVGGQLPLEMLCQGLRALVEQAGLSFRLVLIRQAELSESARPIQAGKDGGALEREARLFGLKPFVGLRLQVAHLPLSRFALARYLPKLALNDRPDLNIAQTLDQHCFLSPIPLTLDGRRLDRLLCHPRWGFGPLRPLVLSGLPGRAQGMNLVPVPEDLEEKVLSLHTDHKTAQQPSGGRREFAAWFLLRAFQPRAEQEWERQLDFRNPVPHQTVLYVNHGVVVDKLQVARQTRQSELLVILSAEGMPTDLSGLSLLVRDPHREDLRRVLDEIAVALKVIAHTADFLAQEGPEPGEGAASLALRRVQDLLPRAPEAMQLGVAAALAAGRRILSRDSELPRVSEKVALEWSKGLRTDILDLEDLGSADISAA